MEKELKEMFGKLNLSKRKKEELWKQIYFKQRAGKRKKGRLASVAVAGFLVLAAGMGIYVLSSGKVIQAMKVLLGIEQKVEKEIQLKENNQDIINGIGNARKHEEIYAPEIVMCTERWLFLANTAGMVVYDRENNQVIMTVDLQELGCSYIGTGTKATRFLQKGDQIYIFNETNGLVEDTYYIFDLYKTDCIEKKSFCEYAKKTRKRKKKQLYEEWRKYKKKHYTDTYDAFQGEKILNTDNIYSEYSFIWIDGKEQEKISSLWIDTENSYFVFTRDQKSGKTKKERLYFAVEESEKTLPEFAYHGKDEIMKVICDYFCEKNKREVDKGWYDREEVYIPMPVILGKVQKKKTVFIFLQLHFERYYKNGMILEKTGAGSQCMRIWLRKTKQGYKVKECIQAMDGFGYHKSIESFTEGYPEIRKKYFDDDLLERKQNKIKKKMYKMYLKTEKPDVAYYRTLDGELKKIEE